MFGHEIGPRQKEVGINLLKTIAYRVPGTGYSASEIQTPPAAIPNDVLRDAPGRNFWASVKLGSTFDELRRGRDSPAGNAT